MFNVSTNKQKVEKMVNEIWTNWIPENAEKLKLMMSPKVSKNMQR
jgi:hypothetical protein